MKRIARMSTVRISVLYLRENSISEKNLETKFYVKTGPHLLSSSVTKVQPPTDSVTLIPKLTQFPNSYK